MGVTASGDRRDMSQLAERMVSVGGGYRVPYPEPTNEAASKFGRANRRVGTKPELALRSTLHRRGLRFRKDHLIRVDGLRVRPDVVFTRQRLAVFVDGCFWHGCPQHQHVPARNQEYWLPKLEANTRRDRLVDRALRADGWRSERFWEHEDAETAADRIIAIVRAAT